MHFKLVECNFLQPCYVMIRMNHYHLISAAFIPLVSPLVSTAQFSIGLIAAGVLCLKVFCNS